MVVVTGRHRRPAHPRWPAAAPPWADRLLGVAVAAAVAVLAVVAGGHLEPAAPRPPPPLLVPRTSATPLDTCPPGWVETHTDEGPLCSGVPVLPTQEGTP